MGSVIKESDMVAMMLSRFDCPKMAARELGIHQQTVYDIRQSKRPIPRHVAAKLGYRQIRAYEKIHAES